MRLEHQSLLIVLVLLEERLLLLQLLGFLSFSSSADHCLRPVKKCLGISGRYRRFTLLTLSSVRLVRHDRRLIHAQRAQGLFLFPLLVELVHYTAEEEQVHHFAFGALGLALLDPLHLFLDAT